MNSSPIYPIQREEETTAAQPVANANDSSSVIISSAALWVAKTNIDLSMLTAATDTPPVSNGPVLNGPAPLPPDDPDDTKYDGRVPPPNLPDKWLEKGTYPGDQSVLTWFYRMVHYLKTYRDDKTAAKSFFLALGNIASSSWLLKDHPKLADQILSLKDGTKTALAEIVDILAFRMWYHGHYSLADIKAGLLVFFPCGPGHDALTDEVLNELNNNLTYPNWSEWVIQQVTDGYSEDQYNKISGSIWGQFILDSNISSWQTMMRNEMIDQIMKGSSNPWVQFMQLMALLFGQNEDTSMTSLHGMSSTSKWMAHNNELVNNSFTQWEDGFASPDPEHPTQIAMDFMKNLHDLDFLIKYSTRLPDDAKDQFKDLIKKITGTPALGADGQPLPKNPSLDDLYYSKPPRDKELLISLQKFWPSTPDKQTPITPTGFTNISDAYKSLTAMGTDQSATQGTYMDQLTKYIQEVISFLKKALTDNYVSIEAQMVQNQKSN